MKTFGPSIPLLAAFLVLAGCATGVWKKEDLLTRAGFRSFTAEKPAELALLKNLPPDRISPVTIKGRTYFVFPDPKKNRLYAGNPPELAAYQRLRARRKLAAERVETARIDQAADFGAWGAIDYGWYSF